MTIKIKNKKNKMSKIDYSQRILLISHCLRPSKKCPAKIDENGLQCICCKNNCAIGQLKKAAEQLNYKGVCVAPGGSLAVKFVEKTMPKGIVAVACSKELAEGVNIVRKKMKALFTNQETLYENKGKASFEREGLPKKNLNIPIIETIPLIKEGCVDTEVDIEYAIEVIRS